MYQRSVFSFILLFFLFSCSEKIKKNSTQITFSYPSFASDRGPVSLDGGVLIAGRCETINDFILLTLDSHQTTVTKTVNNGLWEFAAVGWDASSAGSGSGAGGIISILDNATNRKMEGDIRCGTRMNLNLDGTPKDIDLTLNKDNCNDSLFDPNGAYDLTNNKFPVLKIETCKYLAYPDDVTFGTTCNATISDTLLNPEDFDRVRGRIQSFRFVYGSTGNAVNQTQFDSQMQSWHSNIINTIDNASASGNFDLNLWPSHLLDVGFQSDCFALPTDTSTREIGLQIPIGDFHSDDLPFLGLIFGFSTNDCSSSLYNMREVYDLKGEDDNEMNVIMRSNDSGEWKLFLMDKNDEMHMTGVYPGEPSPGSSDLRPDQLIEIHFFNRVNTNSFRLSGAMIPDGSKGCADGYFSCEWLDNQTRLVLRPPSNNSYGWANDTHPPSSSVLRISGRGTNGGQFSGVYPYQITSTTSSNITFSDINSNEIVPGTCYPFTISTSDINSDPKYTLIEALTIDHNTLSSSMISFYDDGNCSSNYSSQGTYDHYFASSEATLGFKITDFSFRGDFYLRETITGNKSNTLNIPDSFCPAGFIPVPGNNTLGTDDFCVMKFEAKNVSDIPVSKPLSAPWVSINSSDAFDKCKSIGNSGFSLISNPEWMTIARNIENVESNWLDSNRIARGHSDNIPSDPLSVTDVTDHYNGTENSSTSNREQKRVHTLSNGEEIWDFAGNVWEWVDWNGDNDFFDLGPINCATGSHELTASCSGLDSTDYQSIGGFSSSNNFGKLFGGSGGAAIRGGGKGDVDGSGIFTLSLANSAMFTATNTGFRCVFYP